MVPFTKTGKKEKKVWEINQIIDISLRYTEISVNRCKNLTFRREF